MSDWVENYDYDGVRFTDSEKVLIRFAMYKEEERIIKLLEDNEPDNIPFPEDNYWTGFNAAIALIKGEKE